MYHDARVLKGMFHCGSVFVCLCLLLFIGTGPVQADPVIYNQVSNYPNGTAYTSQNDTNDNGLGNFATVYDNFTLNTDTLITDVHWQGAYYFGVTEGNSTAFTIAFWADASGQPGASLLSQTIAGNANQTFVGNPGFGPVYDYSVVLPTSFAATAGTTYWLSIVAVTGWPPHWGWHTDGLADNVLYQDFFGARTQYEGDLAFALTGQAAAVPEPAGLTLLGTGLVFLVGYRIRQRR